MPRKINTPKSKVSKSSLVIMRLEMGALSFFSPIRTRVFMLGFFFVNSGDSTCAWVPTTSPGSVTARRGPNILRSAQNARCSCKDETSADLLRVVSKNQGILAINKRFGQRMDGETTQNRAYTQEKSRCPQLTDSSHR